MRCIGIVVLLVIIWNISSCCVSCCHEQVAEFKAQKELRIQAEEQAKRAAEQKARELAAKKEAARQAEEQAKRAAEQKARELAAKKEAARQAASREEKLRSFTLKEAPVLWTTYQNLQAEIESQDKKINELRGALESFGHNPDTDSDFNRICSMRDEMIASLRTMRAKIEDAYLAARKYEATPSRKDYAELQRKLLEDGIQEAESAAKKFTEMRSEK